MSEPCEENHVYQLSFLPALSVSQDKIAPLGRILLESQFDLEGPGCCGKCCGSNSITMPLNSTLKITRLLYRTHCDTLSKGRHQLAHVQWSFLQIPDGQAADSTQPPPTAGRPKTRTSSVGQCTEETRATWSDQTGGELTHATRSHVGESEGHRDWGAANQTAHLNHPESP